MIVLVPMVMAAPAVMTMLVMMAVLMIVMRMSFGMSVRMGVSVLMVAVVMMVVAVMMPVVVVAVMGAALGPEGAFHRGGDAALSAHQLGHGRIVLHVDGVVRDLDEAMLAAEMPGEAHEAQGVLGPHLQQALGSGLHLDEPPILEPQGVAIVDGGIHIEIEHDLGPALPCQPRLTAVARRVVERDRVDDAVGFHGGLADDGGDAGHGFVSGQE
jgi:hypothetical protein